MVGVETGRRGLGLDLEVLGLREGRRQHTWIGREPGEQDLEMERQVATELVAAGK